MDGLTIKSTRLSVEFASLGAFYTGSRFDWTGFITAITLDGKHPFCVDESLVPGVGTGGKGLCNEFGIYEPIGYDEAKVGECFPKLGVGLLTRRSTEEYRFFEPYPISPFDVHITTKPDSIIFETQPKPCNGYAVLLKKTLTVNDNHMVVDYYLENTGDKTLHTTEYIHNFVSVDHKGTRTQNELTFSFDLKGDSIPEVFDVKGNTIGFKANPEKEFYWAPQGHQGQSSCWWKLIDKETGVGLKESCNFPPQRAAIWGKGHVISPEVFIELLVKPGEAKRWTRSYEFYA